MVVREHIDEAKLSYDQKEKLKLISNADLHAAFNQVLKQRGIPLMVFNVQFRNLLEAGNTPPEKEPPEGGCYCCIRSGDDWACYCC